MENDAACGWQKESAEGKINNGFFKTYVLEKKQACR